MASEAPATDATSIVDPENPAVGLSAPGRSGRVIYVIAVVFSPWQVYTAAYAPFSSIVIRSVHVGFLLLMTYTLFRWRKSDSGKIAVPWYDWCLGGLAFLLGLYHWVFETDLIQRSGSPSTIDQLYLGTEGIYGTPTFVSSTYIFLFILFGAFLEKAGMINLFNALALGMVGHTQGGPAKVAVISSGLMGTINGSGVANVLTVGQFTIPLMRRFGYRPAFAGAVEATSSMGGQIMPPVMGAVAFIMAETLNVPYSTIAITAAIPAFLYYASAFWMVHLEAGRHRLVGLPKDQCPSALAALRRDWHLILPLAALVYMLFAGFTPLFAGTVGLTLTIILILGTALVSPLGSIMVRGGFWIALGLVGGALIASNALSINTVLFTIILTLGAVCLVARDRRATVRILITSLAEGAKSALGVGMSAGTVALCPVLGAKTVTLPTDHVTVAWHHSIEKTGWQEDYVIRGNRLVLTEARIQGTGARMEPPAGAVLRDGWFHYVPKLGPLPELRLTLSPYTADYRLCWNGQCRAVGRILDATAETAVVVLRACAAGPASGRPTTK